MAWLPRSDDGSGERVAGGPFRAVWPAPLRCGRAGYRRLPRHKRRRTRARTTARSKCLRGGAAAGVPWSAAYGGAGRAASGLQRLRRARAAAAACGGDRGTSCAAGGGGVAAWGTCGGTRMTRRRGADTAAGHGGLSIPPLPRPPAAPQPRSRLLNAGKSIRLERARLAKCER